MSGTGIIDIEFNFIGEANIERSISQMFITSASRQQVKAQILGRTLLNSSPGREFAMTIDGVMFSNDENNSSLFCIEIYGHDKQVSKYIRKTFHRLVLKQMRYPRSFLGECLTELDETKKAVFL